MEGRLLSGFSPGRGPTHRRLNPGSARGRRLFSDVEASIVRSLQFSMPVNIAFSASAGSKREENWSDLQKPAGASSPVARSNGLSGNVFVDYTRYRARRLVDVKDLQLCHEGAALRSLAPACSRALLSWHSSAITRLSLDHSRQVALKVEGSGRTAMRSIRYLLSSSRDCSIALYDLEADDAWNLNGGFGPTPKVPPIGLVQRRPDRPPRRLLHPLRFQAAASRPPLVGCCSGSSMTERCTSGTHANLFDFAGPSRGHWHSVTSVDFMPGDNGLFVSVGLDKVFKVWDTRAWETVVAIGAQSPLLCCAFNRNSFQPDTTPHTGSGSSFSPFDHEVTAPSPLLVAAGSQDGTIRIFDVRCGAVQQTLSGHTGAVLATTWSPRCSYQLFSGSFDKSLKCWDLRRSTSCFMSFDKNNPDTNFIGRRWAQSAAFRQLLRSENYIGRGRSLHSVADISAAAASAAFKGEKLEPPAHGAMITSSDCAQAPRVLGVSKELLQIPDCGNFLSIRTAGRSSARKLGQPEFRAVGGPPDCSCARKTAGAVDCMEGAAQSDRLLDYELTGDVGLADVDRAHCQSHSLTVNGGNNVASACAKPLDMNGNGIMGGRGASKRTSGFAGLGDPSKRLQAGYRSPTPMQAQVEGAEALADVRPGEDDGSRTLMLLNQYGQIMKEHRLRTQQNIASAKAHDNLGAHGRILENKQGSSGLTRFGIRPCLEGEDRGSLTTLDIRTKRPASCPSPAAEFLDEAQSLQATTSSSAELLAAGYGIQSDRQRSDLTCSPGRDDPSAGTPTRIRDVRGEAAHDGPVTCLLASPDGSFLISSGGDGRMRLWNADNGCHCFIYMSLKMSFCASPHTTGSWARRHARGLQDSTSCRDVCTVANQNEANALWGRQAALAFGGGNVVHGRGQALCTYNIFTGAEEQIVVPGHSSDVVCVAWNERKGELYSGALDGNILVCDATSIYFGDEEDTSDEETPPVVNIAADDYI
ncbi:hypothetical protein Efla_004922 [Eimeria flavescens]